MNANGPYAASQRQTQASTKNDGKRILIVDDDAQARALVALVLQRQGFDVLEAYDGFSALDVLATVTPDLIILDLMMPGMDGVELCQLVRARPETAATPVIVFTASGSHRLNSSALDAGADDLLSKTALPHELTARVFQHLGIGAARLNR